MLNHFSLNPDDTLLLWYDRTCSEDELFAIFSLLATESDPDLNIVPSLSAAVSAVPMVKNWSWDKIVRALRRDRPNSPLVICDEGFGLKFRDCHKAFASYPHIFLGSTAREKCGVEARLIPSSLLDEPVEGRECQLEEFFSFLLKPRAENEFQRFSTSLFALDESERSHWRTQVSDWQRRVLESLAADFGVPSRTVHLSQWRTMAITPYFLDAIHFAPPENSEAAANSILSLLQHYQAWGPVGTKQLAAIALRLNLPFTLCHEIAAHHGIAYHDDFFPLHSLWDAFNSDILTEAQRVAIVESELRWQKENAANSFA